MTPIRRAPRPTRQVLFLVALLLLTPLAAAQDGPGMGGVLVRVDGDIRIGPNETLEVLVVVGDVSHVEIAGTVGVAVIVGGTLNLTGTVREQLVLVDAHATLTNGSVVEGDIATTDATVDQRPGSRVEGTIEEGRLDRVGPLVSLVFGIIFLVGVPLALVIAGLLAAWLFPRQLRSVGTTLRRRAGATVLSAALIWVGLPLVAFLLMFTLIGIPTGMGILVLLLPFLWVAGFLASGTKLGDLILTSGGKKRARPRPYGASALGIAILLLVGLLPLIGALVVLLAGMYGSGGLVLTAVRSARRPPQTPRATGDTGAGSDEAPWDPGAGGS